VRNILSEDELINTLYVGLNQEVVPAGPLFLQQMRIGRKNALAVNPWLWDWNTHARELIAVLVFTSAASRQVLDWIQTQRQPHLTSALP
jgi:hypothetical protein